MPSIRLLATAILFAVAPARVGLHGQTPGPRPPTASRPTARYLQFIVTSDLHFGITRRVFRGDTGVRAARVNSALRAQINTVPRLTLPADSGIRAGKHVGAIDFLMITGDIANRAEDGVQSASASWTEFRHTILDSLTIKDAAHRRARVLMVPGNHDLSNAIGAPKIADTARDATAAAAIFNRMLKPAVPRTAATFQYPRDHIHFSVDRDNVHLVFLNIWPDSAERTWLAADLAHVPADRPVLLFAHDPPVSDPKHFVNPNGAHDINATDRFENLLAETYRGGLTLPPAAAPGDADNPKPPTVAAQREFVDFLKRHANVTAYFHGHSNFHEFYDYTGPDDDVRLPTFRVDSPMKGARSAKDETRLSFELVTIDTQTQTMTVRECLWNATPDRPLAPVRFGSMRTVSLRPTRATRDVHASP